ncbi:hypothetical protein [Rhizobium sp. BR 314]|uniref:hypothetical protein n=1 Tax=Rhizobium sp. BR 314 TaxID=3040013 RepID=UPI0039BF51E2
MNIRYKFRFKRPFILEDAWPVQTKDMLVELERNGLEATHIVVTFHNQPVSLAPKLTPMDSGPIASRLEMRDSMRTKAVQTIRRFQHFASIHHAIEVNTDDVDVEFIPTDDAEREMIAVSKFQAAATKPKARLTFSMVAQALFATESEDDPSFVVSFLQMAREASLERRYIDAFRFCFLLFESLYGGGKFKTSQLVDEMLSHADFEAMVTQTIDDFLIDPLHEGSKAKELVANHATAKSMIEYLVDRRGFYFHGNIKRKDSWRPDEQQHAEDLSEFTMFLAMAVADSMAAAMFVPGIGRRYFENAKQFGAIMTATIRYRTRDEHDRFHDDIIDIEAPATVATNDLAIRIHHQFLDWAQTELHDVSLVSAIAKDKATGVELFRAQYLSPVPPRG